MPRKVYSDEAIDVWLERYEACATYSQLKEAFHDAPDLRSLVRWSASKDRFPAGRTRKVSRELETSIATALDDLQQAALASTSTVAIKLAATAHVKISESTARRVCGRLFEYSTATSNKPDSPLGRESDEDFRRSVQSLVANVPPSHHPPSLLDPGHPEHTAMLQAETHGGVGVNL